MDGLVKRAVSFGLSILCLMFSFSTPVLAGDLFDVRAKFGAVEVRLNDRVGYGKNYSNATFRLLNGRQYGAVTTFGARGAETHLLSSSSSSSSSFSPSSIFPLGTYAKTSFSACSTLSDKTACPSSVYAHTPVTINFLSSAQSFYVENCLAPDITCERAWVHTDPRVVMTDTAQGAIYSIPQPDLVRRESSQLSTGDAIQPIPLKAATFEIPISVAYNTQASSMYVLQGFPYNEILNCAVNGEGTPDPTTCTKMDVEFGNLTDMSLQVAPSLNLVGDLFVADSGRIRQCPLDDSGNFDHCDVIAGDSIKDVQFLTFNNISGELWAVGTPGRTPGESGKIYYCSASSSSTSPCVISTNESTSYVLNNPGKPVILGKDQIAIPNGTEVASCKRENYTSQTYTAEGVPSLSFDQQISAMSPVLLPALNNKSLAFLLSFAQPPTGYDSSLLLCRLDESTGFSFVCNPAALPTGATDVTSMVRM